MAGHVAHAEGAAEQGDVVIALDGVDGRSRNAGVGTGRHAVVGGQVHCRGSVAAGLPERVQPADMVGMVVRDQHGGQG